MIEKAGGKCYNKTIEALYGEFRIAKAEMALLSGRQNRIKRQMR